MPFGGALTVGLIGAGTSLFGGLMGASASGKASKQYIAALQQAQQSLQGTEQQGLNTLQPFTTAGTSATTSLSNLLGTPGQGLLQPYGQTFTAPTAAQAQQTPGYQFQLQQGLNAAQNSAAGQGSLLSGRTLADLNNYAQGVASTNYQNTFNNSLTQYQQAYQQFLNNQNNQYSRLLGLGSLGMQGAQGQAGLISGIGGDIASLYGQQGAAAAQGTIGQANAYSNMFSGFGNAATSGLLLSALNGQSGLAGLNIGDYSLPASSTLPGSGAMQIPGMGLPALGMSSLPGYIQP